MKQGTTPKVTTLNKNNIQIIGDNILYNNGIITAYYLLPTINYRTTSADGVMRGITELTKLIQNITTQRPHLQFTITGLDKVISAKDVKNNLIDTIRMYREDFDMPTEFSDNITDDIQSYSLLCVDIQQKELGNVEEYSFKDTMKEMFGSVVDKVMGLGNLNLDEPKILSLEDKLFISIRHKCVRATKELVFYSFVSRTFPCYDISYEKLSFMNEDNFEGIMGTLVQNVNDNFGWFEMKNTGVDLFGLEVQDTYGCIIDIKEFPETILSYDFPMNYPNTTTSIKCLKKEEAAIKLKRTRGSDRYEQNQAAKAGADLETTERLEQNIDLATRALYELDDGATMCRFSTSILVTALTRKELSENVSAVLAELKSRDILASKSLHQALDFLNNYISLRPKKYDHFANIQFPLSFQQNNGSIVGDAGTGIFSAAIGEDI